MSFGPDSADRAAQADAAYLREQRLVLDAAARLAAESDPVAVVVPWRPGLTKEAAQAAASAGSRFWIRRSRTSLIIRFARLGDEGPEIFAGLTSA